MQEGTGFYSIHILGQNFHLDTIVYSWVAIFILVIFSVLTRRSLALVPGKLQSLFEFLYDSAVDLAESMMGESGRRYVPFVLTMFLFILVCNWIGAIPALIPPTRDINTTAALAIISFLAFNYFGIQKNIERYREHHPASSAPGAFMQGLKDWVLHFIEPLPSLLPMLWNSLDGALKFCILPFLFPLFCILFPVLNIIEELLRILSLSVRLMGNIMGKHIVTGILLALVLSITPRLLSPVIWGISFFVALLSILISFIQAFIFAILTLSYIAGATEGH